MGTNTMALIQTCQIQAIMTVPQRLSFFAHLSNCNLVTCWHIELSILGLVHLSISIHWSNSFTCSITFFSFEKSLGLALGESCHIQGSPLRPFPRVLRCPMNIPKITIVHVIGCSLNLHISYHCSSDFWEYGQRLVEYGQAIEPLNLLPSGHPLLNKHNRFQDEVPSHVKSCTAHSGRHMAKKAQIQ